MRALSLTQPWATLVAIAAKKIETRSWSTGYRGLVAIHATRALPVPIIVPQRAVSNQAVLDAIYEALRSQPRGAVVAVARIVDCRSTGRFDGSDDPNERWVHELSLQEGAFGDYTPGRYGWFLEDVRALPEPVPCRGMQGLWRVPADVWAQVEQQLAAGSVR